MSPEKRSAVMARIRGKDTGPEKLIAKALLDLGLAFECHSADLPGKPDIVFRSKKIAIFIDGDFWHGWRFSAWRHKLSAKWETKIEANRLRDRRNFSRLRKLGWKVIRVWEHQIDRDAPRCVARLREAILP